MSFDLDLWPTDLNINRGHLLIKNYLPTKFEASGTKLSWVISCTRWSRLAWPLTLTFDLLTWISKGVIYSSRTIYLPSLKLLGQSVLELSVAQGEVDWHDLLTLTFDLLTWISIEVIYSSSAQVWSFLGTHSWVISCTRLRDTDIPTYWPTCAKQYAPLFSSPEPKALVSYCHSAPSVVRPSVRRPSVRPSVRKLFTFSTSSPEPLDGFWWNLVGMKYSWSLTSVVVFRPDPPRGGSRAGPK